MMLWDVMNNRMREKLSKVTNSTVKVGCVSEMVKGELHERWPNLAMIGG